MNTNKNKEDKKYLYGLTLIPEIGPVSFDKIQNTFETFEQAWNASQKQWHKTGISKNAIGKIFARKQNIDLDSEYEKLLGSEIRFIHRYHEAYPKQLKEIKSAPFVLFYLGNIEVLKKKQLAIVGTRMPSKYGQMAAEKLAFEVSNAGLVVTSGLAHGIDSISHKAALSLANPTVAVLGSGLEIGLEGNRAKTLAEEIIQHGGAIISEYPPNFPASKITFPARNRIVSGLSLGVLVIEGGERSGTLITANYALEQNREVFAVPGNIFSPKSMGTHKLLKEGARLAHSAKDILETFNFVVSSQQTVDQERIFEDEQEKLIYGKLSFEPLHIDVIAKKCNLDPPKVAAKMSMMELRGWVRNLGGGMFIRQ